MRSVPSRVHHRATNTSSTPGQPPTPGRWCLLRHDLPDGTWHYDLLIVPRTPTPDAARPLVALRLPSQTDPGPHEPSCAGFEGEPIGDHRAVYLEYQGEISGGRGRVKRVAAGTDGEIERGDRWVIALEGIRYEGTPIVGSPGKLRFVRS